MIDGLHHVKAITACGRTHHEFYERALGLSLVKQTVNPLDPTQLCLFYGDASASPGTLLAFIHEPRARKATLTNGMAFEVALELESSEALSFWASRLRVPREGDELRLSDPDGLSLRLVSPKSTDQASRNSTPSDDEIPAGYRIRRIAGVVAKGSPPSALLETAGFITEVDGRSYRTESGSFIDFDGSHTGPGHAGTAMLIEVVWSATKEALTRLRERAVADGCSVSPLSDERYYHSLSLRSPEGVIQVASPSPGFSFDEPVDALGRRLMLPAELEAFRTRLEPRLQLA